MKNTLILIFLTLSVNAINAQPPVADKQHGNAMTIAGTYSLVSVDNILADGSRIHLYGPNPQGELIFDAAGHYSLQIYRNGRNKFASGDKSKGTDEEDRAAIQGCNAHFGTYSVNEETHTITFNIEHASFPNWEGTQQKRPFTLNGNTFKYTVSKPTSGGAVTGEVEWKRIE